MQELSRINTKLDISNSWTLEDVYQYVHDVEKGPTKEWVSNQEFDEHLWLCGLVLTYDLERTPSMISMVYDFTQMKEMVNAKNKAGLNKLFPHILYFDDEGVLRILRYVGILSKYLSSLLHGRAPNLKSIGERDWQMIRILLLMERIKMATHISKFPDASKANGNLDIGYSILTELYKLHEVKHVPEIYTIRIFNGLEREKRIFDRIKTLDNLRLRLFMKVVDVQ